MTKKVQFQTNIPVDVVLKYDQGKEVQGNFGPQIMFSLAESPHGETTMYVPPIVADRLKQLNVTRGARVRITKAEVTRDKRRSIEWQVVRLEAQDSGAEAGPQAANPKGPAPAPANTGGESGVQRHEHTTPASGTAKANGNGHPAKLPPMQMQFGAAFEQFLVDAGRSIHRAETQLAAEGISFRPDNRDTVASATTMFIEAARRGSLIWTPAEAA